MYEFVSLYSCQFKSFVKSICQQNIFVLKQNGIDTKSPSTRTRFHGIWTERTHTYMWDKFDGIVIIATKIIINLYKSIWCHQKAFVRLSRFSTFSTFIVVGSKNVQMRTRHRIKVAYHATNLYICRLFWFHSSSVSPFQYSNMLTIPTYKSEHTLTLLAKQ